MLNIQLMRLGYIESFFAIKKTSNDAKKEISNIFSYIRYNYPIN